MLGQSVIVELDLLLELLEQMIVHIKRQYWQLLMQPCDKGGVPTPRKSCGAAVFSCKGLGGASPGRGAYHVARVYVLDFRSAP